MYTPDFFPAYIYIPKNMVGNYDINLQLVYHPVPTEKIPVQFLTADKQFYVFAIKHNFLFSTGNWNLLGQTSSKGKPSNLLALTVNAEKAIEGRYNAINLTLDKSVPVINKQLSIAQLPGTTYGSLAQVYYVSSYNGKTVSADNVNAKSTGLNYTLMNHTCVQPAILFINDLAYPMAAAPYINWDNVSLACDSGVPFGEPYLWGSNGKPDGRAWIIPYELTVSASCSIHADAFVEGFTISRLASKYNTNLIQLSNNKYLYDVGTTAKRYYEFITGAKNQGAVCPSEKVFLKNDLSKNGGIDSVYYLSRNKSWGILLDNFSIYNPSPESINNSSLWFVKPAIENIENTSATTTPQEIINESDRLLKEELDNNKARFSYYIPYSRYECFYKHDTPANNMDLRAYILYYPNYSGMHNNQIIKHGSINYIKHENRSINIAGNDNAVPTCPGYEDLLKNEKITYANFLLENTDNHPYWDVVTLNQFSFSSNGSTFNVTPEVDNVYGNYTISQLQTVVNNAIANLKNYPTPTPVSMGPGSDYQCHYQGYKGSSIYIIFNL